MVVLVLQYRRVGADADVKVAVGRRLAEELHVTAVEQVVAPRYEHLFPVCHIDDFCCFRYVSPAVLFVRNGFRARLPLGAHRTAQEVRKVRAVLARDTGNQCGLHYHKVLEIYH